MALATLSLDLRRRGWGWLLGFAVPLPDIVIGFVLHRIPINGAMCQSYGVMEIPVRLDQPIAGCSRAVIIHKLAGPVPTVHDMFPLKKWMVTGRACRGARAQVGHVCGCADNGLGGRLI